MSIQKFQGCGASCIAQQCTAQHGMSSKGKRAASFGIPFLSTATHTKGTRTDTRRLGFLPFVTPSDQRNFSQQKSFYWVSQYDGLP